MENKVYHCHERANSRTIAKLSEFRCGARHWQGSCIKTIMTSGESGKRTTNA
jgi:hypothetical protein